MWSAWGQLNLVLLEKWLHYRKPYVRHIVYNLVGTLSPDRISEVTTSTGSTVYHNFLIFISFSTFKCLKVNILHLYHRLQRLAIILLTMHYTVELLFHLARVVKYHSKGSIPNKIYKVWRVLFLTGRIVTVILSVLTLWFGLGREARKDSQEPPSEEEEAWPKQFNTPLFRFDLLVSLSSRVPLREGPTTPPP